MNSGSKHRAAIGLLVLASLLLAVAVASTGSVPVGSGGTRPPSYRLVDVTVSLFLAWIVLVTRIAPRRPRRARDRAAPRYEPEFATGPVLVAPRRRVPSVSSCWEHARHGEEGVKRDRPE